MRCFISINIPREVEDKIKEIQRQIKRLGLIEAKFVKKGLFHLTLKFLGEIDERNVGEVKKKLREIKLSKFETEINEIGVFSEKFIRIIWVYLARCNILQELVDEKLKDLFKPEKRFMSHLTIARVKSIKDKEKFLEKLKKIEIPKIKFAIDKFYLMKSELTSERPKYEIIEEYELI